MKSISLFLASPPAGLRAMKISGREGINAGIQNVPKPRRRIVKRCVSIASIGISPSTTTKLEMQPEEPPAS